MATPIAEQAGAQLVSQPSTLVDDSNTLRFDTVIAFDLDQHEGSTRRRGQPCLRPSETPPSGQVLANHCARLHRWFLHRRGQGKNVPKENISQQRIDPLRRRERPWLKI